MASFVVPAQGLPLAHTQRTSKEPQQIIRIDLNERINRDLLRSVKTNEPVRIRLGRKPGLTIGTKNVSLLHGTSKFSQEIFSGSLDGAEPAYFSGKLSLTLETQNAREATAGVDHALTTLKNTMKSAQEERANNETGVLGNRLLKPLHRPSPLSGGLLGSRPSSPFMASGFSPRPGAGPTSAPLLAGPSKQEKIKLDAIKIPVIHLLAIQPQNPQELADMLRVKRTDLDKVLDKVSRPAERKRELKDRSYRDLDLWKFPYRSQNDRQAAIDRAISAYDRLRVDKSDNLWQMLLATEDRGKGINLSRLNFDKPLATGNLTPKLPERSTDSGSTEGKSMASDQSNKRGRAPVPKMTDTHTKTKSTVDTKSKASTTKDPLKMMAAASKESKKAQTISQPSAKQTTKYYKSSEKVQDSDDETEAAPAVVPPKSGLNTKRPAKHDTTADSRQSDKRLSTLQSVPSSRQPITLPPKPPISSIDSGVERGRTTPSMAKTRSGADTAKSQPASRPRNGSSPAKPSPLGSSPPNNLRDADSTSNSSKGTSQSSAPSSPPSSADLSNGRRRNYSPVVTGKKIDRSTNGAMKRKADSNDDDPPAKRQHVGKDDAGQRERFSVLPKAITDEVEKNPSKRGSPETDASSNSEKVVTKQHVIEEARRFHKYWDKYKELHDRLSKDKGADRDEKDLDNLWKMHTRLKGIKEQIWKDWAKIEKIESTTGK